MRWRFLSKGVSHNLKNYAWLRSQFNTHTSYVTKKSSNVRVLHNQKYEKRYYGTNTRSSWIKEMKIRFNCWRCAVIIAQSQPRHFNRKHTYILEQSYRVINENFLSETQWKLQYFFRKKRVPKTISINAVEKLGLILRSMPKKNTCKIDKSKREEITRTIVMYHIRQQALMSFRDRFYQPFRDWFDPLTHTIQYGLLLTWLIFISYEKITKLSPETDLTNPIHHLHNDAAKKILKLLARNRNINYYLDSSHIDMFSPKIDAIFLTGVSGSGKSQLLLDIKTLYGGPEALASLKVFDCREEFYFQYQVIRSAQQLGLLLIQGNPINYDTAVDYLSNFLAKHPGWLLCFDNIDSPEMMKFIRNFLEKVYLVTGNQKGQFVITSPLRKSRKLIKVLEEATNTYKVFEYNLSSKINEASNQEMAYKLLDKVTQPLYKEIALSNFQAFFKNTEIVQAFNPGYPHTDEMLKKQLIQFLGFSPQAIYTAGMYLSTEHKLTGREPSVLINEYIEKIQYLLGKQKSNLLFQSPKYLSNDQLQELHEDICKVTYRIALNRLVERKQQENPQRQRVIDAAIDSILPMCISLDANHLHMGYIQAYISRLNKEVQSEEKLNTLEIEAAVSLLCDYFLLKRYFTKEPVDDYLYHTSFHVHPSLRDAYLDFHIKGTTALTEKSLKTVQQFTKEIFTLDSDYLKNRGSDWQYVAHCLSVTFPLKTENNDSDPINGLPTISSRLAIINPVLNMLVQMGEIKELELLFTKMDRLLKKELEMCKLKLPDIHFQDSIPLDITKPEVEHEDLIKIFCRELEKNDSYLPVRITQFYYYYSRRMLKSKLSETDQSKAYQYLRLAIEMRKVIKQEKMEIDKGMQFEVIKFQRDGLAVYYLQKGDRESLGKSESLLKTLKKEDSKVINEMHCNHHLMLVFAKQAEHCLNDDLEVKRYLDQAEILLNENEKSHNKLNSKRRRYAKAKRDSLIRSIIDRVKILDQESRSPDDQVLSNMINKTIKQLNTTIAHLGADQRNDRAVALRILGEMHLKAIINSNNQSSDCWSHLEMADAALTDAITLYEKIKINPYDQELIETYQLKLRCHVEQGKVTFSEQNYLKADQQVKVAKSLLGKISELTTKTNTFRDEIKQLQADVETLSDQLEQQQMEEMRIIVLNR